MKNKIFQLKQRIKSFVGNKTCLLAVSGGKDSILMAHIMIETLGDRCIIGHFNHKSRPSSDDDEKLVKLFADRRGVKFFTGSLKAKCPKGVSLEAFYREKRYEFLNKLREKLRIDILCVAHTANDIVETFLFKLFTGRSLRIPAEFESESQIYRPLYTWRTDEVLRAVDWLNLEFATDETNDDLRFDRNFLRHQLQAIVNRFGQKAINNCLAAIQRFESLQTDKQAVAEMISEFLLISPEPVEKLRKLASCANDGFVDLVFENVALKLFGFNIGPTHLQRLKNFVASHAQKTQFPQGITLVKSKNTLKVVKNTVEL